MQSPEEELKFIHDVIKDRSDKNEATFFSVKLERNGNITPLVSKESGDVFYPTIVKYLSRYDKPVLVIELYHGKAINIKTPFQTFRIPLRPMNEPSLGIITPEIKDPLPVTPTENVIPVERHYSSLFDSQRQMLDLQFEIKRLQIENTELSKKCKKRKRYIEELEEQIYKDEKNKKQSLGNVSMGMAGANAIEYFAKSDFGLGILKHIFKVQPEVMNGLLGNADNKEDGNNGKKEEPKTNASFVVKKEEKPLTEQEKKRLDALKSLSQFFDSLNEGELRIYFEIIRMMGKDANTLQNIYQLLKLQLEHKAEEAKKAATPSVKAKNNEEKEKQQTPANQTTHPHTETSPNPVIKTIALSELSFIKHEDETEDPNNENPDLEDEETEAPP